MKTGKKIRYLRENRFGRSLTQDELCIELNRIADGFERNKKGNPPFTMFINALSKYETGKIDVSSIELIQALCIFFEISPSYFIVTKMPFIEEVFELDFDALSTKKIQLKKLSDSRIKSLIEYDDELVCKEFAVKLPLSTELIFDSKMDYLLLDNVRLLPLLQSVFYIRVISLNHSNNSLIVDKDNDDIEFGSYLIYFSNLNELGIFEKFEKENRFFSFKNGTLNLLGSKTDDSWFFIGLICNEEVIVKNNILREEIHDAIINDKQDYSTGYDY